MRKIAGYLTKNRSGKDQKIAQSTHEKGYIKPRKTFWRNSKQLLIVKINQIPPITQEPSEKMNDFLRKNSPEYLSRHTKPDKIPHLPLHLSNIHQPRGKIHNGPPASPPYQYCSPDRLGLQY